MEEKLSKDSSLDEIFRLLSDEKKGVRVGDNVFLRMTYPNCFKGSEVEEWLLANLSNVTSKEAYSVAQKLFKKGYINHVSSNLIPFTRACFYRFDPQKLEEKNSTLSTTLQEEEQKQAVEAFKQEGKNNECIGCILAIAQEEVEKEKGKEENSNNEVEEINEEISPDDHLYALRNVELKNVTGELVKFMDLFNSRDIIVLALLRHFG